MARQKITVPPTPPSAGLDAPEPAARAARLHASAAKFVAPFALDPTMRFYSPQENVDALDHPRVKAWIRFVTTRYEPELPDGHRILLLLPCTRTKPYPMSAEHRAINGALEAAGFRPTGTVPGPDGMPDVSPLVRRNVVVHRMVLSEPLGIVPYEHVYRFRGKPSPASSYDDPGLFENRGTSVSPWRADCTAVPGRKDGTWLWGDNERKAYVEMHNAMSDVIATVLDRIGGLYRRRIGWVAPGLTHRSFLLAAGARSAEGVAAERRVGAGALPLVGVNDRTTHPVEVLPTPDMLVSARMALKARLAAEGRPCGDRAVTAVYARGGGGATPLALPELLAELVPELAVRPRRR